MLFNENLLLLAADLLLLVPLQLLFQSASLLLLVPVQLLS